jgi:hypothetical protein
MSAPAPSTVHRRLRLEDIEELRAYERHRQEFRRQIIALKRLRRVAVGPIVTLVFENRDTIRFQIQEMARAERMDSDEQIGGELDVYNPLIPGPGELSATLFVELIDQDALRRWLPRLVGIERAVELRIGRSGSLEIVRCVPEAAHAEQLTREDATSSVHYVRFALGPEQVERFAAGPVRVAVVLPAYEEASVLDDAVRAELLHDLGP